MIHVTRNIIILKIHLNAMGNIRQLMPKKSLSETRAKKHFLKTLATLHNSNSNVVKNV